MNFSILIALYNREKYIEKCLKSCLAQNYSDYEIVIVDDGSTDKSLEIVKDFDTNKIRIVSAKHSGCWSAKNLAIKNAKGDFVVFIDSDDFISKDYLEKLNKTITKNPTFDYYYPQSLLICNEDGSTTKHIWRYSKVTNTNRNLIIYNFYHKGIGVVPHAGAAIRRSLFNEIGFYNEELYNFSDTEYILAHAEEILFFPLENYGIYYNRQHDNQTNKNTYQKAKSRSFMLDMIIDKYPAKYFFPELNLELTTSDRISVVKSHVSLFMMLAQKSQYNLVFMEKAQKYLRLQRKLESVLRETSN